MEAVLFATSAALPLAKRIIAVADPAHEGMQLRPGSALVDWFSDGEPRVEITESVEGVRVVVIGSFGGGEVEGRPRSVNDNFEQLKTLLDALHRAGAEFLTLIIPYFAYARQDRFTGEKTSRTGITAKRAAEEIQRAAPSLRHVCAIEPHNDYLAAHFTCRFDVIHAFPLCVPHIRKILADAERIVVVSPDEGGGKRAGAYATHHGVSRPVVYLEKRRTAPGQSKVIQVSGEVEGLDAVIVDDMIDGGGTICEAAFALKERGARNVFAIAAHGVFSGSATARIIASPIERVFILDTIERQIPPEAAGKITAISSAGLLREVIYRRLTRGSIREMGSLREPRETPLSWVEKERI